MFASVTKFIIKQMDPRKELVPVENIADHEHFRPFCLLKKRKKKPSIWHPEPYYKQTGFSLNDVLLPGKKTESLLPTGDGQDSSQFTLTKVTAGHVETALDISVDPVSAGVKGGASLSKEFSIKPQKKVIPMELLAALSEERQINMDHSFIQQLQKSDFHLYVVCETLETSEETVYKESNKAYGSILAKFKSTLLAKGSRDNKQGIVIPKGCTLAFRAIQLSIDNGKWDPDYFTSRTCVVEDPRYFVEETSRSNFESLPQGKLPIVVKEVELRCAIFSELSSGLLVMLLNIITAVMRDSNLFEELSQKMENVLDGIVGYELKTESSDLKDLFSTLEKSPRSRCFRLAEAITYTLDALTELLEGQLLLLLQSLERKIVSQQLKLVGNLLEHDLEEGSMPFNVDASLLSFPRQEEQGLTMGLVELSGVKLQEDGLAVPMEKPFEAVAALYVALYVLNLLSGSK